MKISQLLFVVAVLISTQAIAGPGEPILLARPIAVAFPKSSVHKAKDVRALAHAKFVRASLEEKCDSALPNSESAPKLQSRRGRDSEVSPYEIGTGEPNINCELAGSLYICAAVCTASGGYVD